MHGRSGVYSIQPHRTGTDRLGIRPSTISSDQIHRFLSQNKAKSIIWARQAGTHYFIRLAWSKLIDPRCWVLHVAAALAGKANQPGKCQNWEYTGIWPHVVLLASHSYRTVRGLVLEKRLTSIELFRFFFLLF